MMKKNMIKYHLAGSVKIQPNWSNCQGQGHALLELKQGEVALKGLSFCIKIKLYSFRHARRLLIYGTVFEAEQHFTPNGRR